MKKKKPRRGRPPKPEGERVRQTTIGLLPEIWDTMDEIWTREGLNSRAEWITNQVRKTALEKHFFRRKGE